MSPSYALILRVSQLQACTVIDEFTHRVILRIFNTNYSAPLQIELNGKKYSLVDGY